MRPKPKWAYIVADFYHYYDIHPNDIFDMGFHTFMVCLLGLGEQSAWMTSRLADKKDETKSKKPENREAAEAARKVERAESDEELNNQFAQVAHVLKML